MTNFVIGAFFLPLKLLKLEEFRWTNNNQNINQQNQQGQQWRPPDGKPVTTEQMKMSIFSAATDEFLEWLEKEQAKAKDNNVVVQT